MNSIRAIRTRLGMSQQQLADELGCSQTNVSFYEKGQTVLPEAARKLIDVARSRGLVLSYEHIYDGAELPAAETAKAA